MAEANNLFKLRPYQFRPSKDQWKHISEHEYPETKALPSEFRLVTWNVDFSTDQLLLRISTVLGNLQKRIFGCGGGEAPVACCILLQEVHVRALPIILENEWVRAHFVVSQIAAKHWGTQAVYGNLTLVSRDMPVVRVMLLQFGSSKMHRNAVMCDVLVGAPEEEEGGGTRAVTMRVANTHLESLVQGEQARPGQLKLVGKFLRDEEMSGDLYGGIVGGDMNAIGPYDTQSVAAAGLRDAWKKGDQSRRGFTWGYQPIVEYPPGRLDKVLYVDRGGRYSVDEPARVGVDLRCDYPQKLTYASDHYGLVTNVHIKPYSISDSD